MIAKCARAYVVALLVAERLLVASSLLPQMRFLIGAHPLGAEYGQALLVGSLKAGLPVACFAKNNRIVKNELKSYPNWLRGMVIAFCVYGFAVMFIRTASFFNPGLPMDTLAVGGFTLGFDALWLCVPYSVLRSGAISEAEFINRSRISSIVAILATAIFIASRAGGWRTLRP